MVTGVRTGWRGRQRRRIPQQRQAEPAENDYRLVRKRGSFPLVRFCCPCNRQDAYIWNNPDDRQRFCSRPCLPRRRRSLRKWEDCADLAAGVGHPRDVVRVRRASGRSRVWQAAASGRSAAVQPGHSSAGPQCSRLAAQHGCSSVACQFSRATARSADPAPAAGSCSARQLHWRP